MKRSLIVFDLDGTLVDSAGDLRAAVNRVLADLGRRPLALHEVIAMIGDGAPKLLGRALAATGAVPQGDALAALQHRFIACYLDGVTVHTRPYPDVVPTLARLSAAGFRFAICTNKPGGPARRVVADLEFADDFVAVVGGDEVTARKPHPGHVEAVLAAAGAEVREAVMVGDSANDIAAGRGAGLPAIAVTYGYGCGGLGAAGATLTIDRFSDLPAALAAI